MPAAASWGYFRGYIFRAFRRGESRQNRAEIGLRAAVHEMGVYVKRNLGLGVPGQILHHLDVCTGQDQIGDVCVPEDVRRHGKVDRDPHARVTHGLAELFFAEHGLAALRALCRSGLAAHDVPPGVAVRRHAPRISSGVADDAVTSRRLL